MLEPVVDHEGVVFVEIAVVEHEKKLAIVRTEDLGRMRGSGRKERKVAHTDIIDEVMTVRIDRRDAGRSVKHVGPFGSLVPMHLTHATGIQAHVHTSKCRGNAQLTPGHLAGPAGCLQSHMGVGKRETQVRQRPVIGRRRHEDIRILSVAHQIPRASIGAAATWPLWLRDGVPGLRLCDRGCCQ